MKDFLNLLKRYVPPYKGSLIWAVVLNILSAIFNIFSFALIIPILQILFKMDTNVYEFIPWESAMPLKDIAMNNAYYYITVLIATKGASTTLLFLGLFFGFVTLIKTSCYFGASAVMIPLRTGIVRDIRVQVYNKVIGLPMSFFSQQRKGDIIARMSGDGAYNHQFTGHAPEEPYPHPVLLHNPHLHQLATYPLYNLSCTYNGMGNEPARQKTQETVSRGTEEME